MPLCFKFFNYLFTDYKTVFADIHLGFFAQCSVIVKDIDHFEFMFYADVVVVYVVCRSNLKAAGSEFPVNIFIGNHWYGAVEQRN